MPQAIAFLIADKDEPERIGVLMTVDDGFTYDDLLTRLDQAGSNHRMLDKFSIRFDDEGHTSTMEVHGGYPLVCFGYDKIERRDWAIDLADTLALMYPGVSIFTPEALGTVVNQSCQALTVAEFAVPWRGLAVFDV